MKELKAIYPILYLAHQYKIGDKLPANDKDMVKAWTEAGTAEWMESEENETKDEITNPATAQAGEETKESEIPEPSEMEETQELDGEVEDQPKIVGRTKKK